jgi:cysteinyl-tRNA synthetase
MEGQEERMTRSLGNVVWIRDALARYRPDGIRLFLLSSHYRSPMTWREEAVAAAERGAGHLRAAVEAAETLLRRTRPSGRTSPAAQRLREAVARYRAEFRKALDDDFDTPSALASLHALAAELNRLTDALAKSQTEAGSPEDAAQAVEEAREALRELGGVLGLRLVAPVPASLAAALRRLLDEEEALREVDGHGPPELVLDRVLEARQRARERRDFSTADRIRQRLAELGVSVEDYPGGSRWRIRDGT